MANDLNQCNFIGRLGKDPETRYTGSGNAVTNFSIACGWKSKDKEGTEWINCVAFGKLAEIVGEYCAKGKQVFVTGQLKTEKYQDSAGNDRYATKIYVNSVQLLGSGDSAKSDPAQRQQAAQSMSSDQSYKAGNGRQYNDSSDMEDD